MPKLSIGRLQQAMTSRTLAVTVQATVAFTGHAEVSIATSVCWRSRCSQPTNSAPV